jgi:pyruvate,water dikinase
MALRDRGASIGPVSRVPLTLSFSQLAPSDLPLVGGKGANLGALARAGVRVPPGFCVTTEAFERFIAALPGADALFARLELLDGTSVDAARAAAEAMRSALHALVMPDDVARAIVAAWRSLGPEHPLAVRSSATAEDLPGASFAGQQDTYLNVRGERALLDAVRRCWISLFTDRAVLYRARGGFGHRAVRLSVVVQQLIDPEVSGILFTADPISGHRQVISVDAGFGLGEALVSGLISADLYRVDRRTGEVLLARPGKKAFAVRSSPGGGTVREELPERVSSARALDDAQLRALAEMGDRVERLYAGVPQDIEWCIADGVVHVVQARPITSLFPLPEEPPAEPGLHVYLSFGHVQMMTDAMPRLAREVWRLFFPAGKERFTLPAPGTLSPVMVPAGSRLYLDVTGVLRVPGLRTALLGVLSHVYEMVARGLQVFVARPEFRAARPRTATVTKALRILAPVFVRLPARLLLLDPARAAARFDRAVVELPHESERRIRAADTPAARIRQSMAEMNGLFARLRRFLPGPVSGMLAYALLRRLARASWADDVRPELELLPRGLPWNVTTEMDLAVGDLTDVLRPHPALIELIRTAGWASVRGALATVDGGSRLAGALEDFLARYGNRSASEIDLSRPRWRDDPSLLLRVMVGGLAASDAGMHRRQHRAQAEAGEAAGAKLIAAAGSGPVGPLRRPVVARLVRVARHGMGLREHPKFIIIQLLGVVRAEVVAAGKLLAGRGQLVSASDVWHVGFEELAAALDDPAMSLAERVAARAAELRADRERKPPLLFSSDGEVPVVGAGRSDLPAGALPGTAASAGVVEGIAHVVTDPTTDTLHAGEILVAPYTDPGWTPLFVHAAGVVTEVGGMMTHGAVVAREYGIPAVVSVASAVDRIRTGQRIRVDGTRGFVEILEPGADVSG